MSESHHYIHPDQLCVGLYIHLDLSWTAHPFTFSNFKIKNNKQLEELKGLGLHQFRYDPLRSDCEPLPLQETINLAPAAEIVETPKPAEPVQVKLKLRAERLKQLNRIIAQCEKEFMHSAQTVREINRNLAFQPKTSRLHAELLVNQLVSSAVTERDIALHAIGASTRGEETYAHSLNVAILSLMLAKSLDMSESDARDLGAAALFHDVSKGESTHHQTFLNQHCEIGARMVREAGMSDRIVNIVLQHHEYVDGSGYPRHLVGEQMDPLARILSLTNAYDNLCNPVNPSTAMTPYETLAHMYAKAHQKYDEKLLQLLIKLLGVYPPGSIVQLSNGVYGMVLTAHPTKPLMPLVMLYIPKVSRETPIVIDLSEETSLSITHCIRPSQLPAEAYEYLRPRSRISYYFLKENNRDTPLSLGHAENMRVDGKSLSMATGTNG